MGEKYRGVRTAISIIPPQEVQDYLLGKLIDLTFEYDSFQAVRRPLTITLKWPFFTKDISQLESYVADLAEQRAGFRVAYDGYGWFDDKKVIYANVAPSEEITGLHVKVLDDLKEGFNIKKKSYEGAQQVFHTTLMRGDGEMENSEFERAKREVQGWDMPYQSFIANTIALSVFKNRKWKIIGEYKLQPAKFTPPSY